MTNAIETSNLTKYYDTLCAVDDLTLSINNEIFALLGPNGSGKTTTVLMLTTLLHPTRGSAMVCGNDIISKAEEVRSSISYVPQDMAVDIKLTGRENVRFFADLYGVPHAGDRVDEVLAVMELTDRADDLIRTYSGGMRRRLELAQALVHEPSVLFLDEPTIGLDVAARKKIWEHIRNLRKKGMTIFVTTHYMDEAEYCDRLGLVYRGELIALGTSRELKTHFMEEEIVELLCDRPQDAMETIEAIPGIRHAALFGRSLHVVAQGVEATIPVMGQVLAAAGFTVSGMERITPSLEDVFVSLIEARDRQEAPQEVFSR